MPLIDTHTARCFAESSIDAWNRHELDAVLSHYADDFEFSSPLIVEIAGEPNGRLKGKNAIRAYWAKGLEVVSGPNPQRGGETILFRDPSGNILEICYPSLHEWASGGREYL